MVAFLHSKYTCYVSPLCELSLHDDKPMLTNMKVVLLALSDMGLVSFWWDKFCLLDVLEFCGFFS